MITAIDSRMVMPECLYWMPWMLNLSPGGCIRFLLPVRERAIETVGEDLILTKARNLSLLEISHVVQKII